MQRQMAWAVETNTVAPHTGQYLEMHELFVVPMDCLIRDKNLMPLTSSAKDIRIVLFILFPQGSNERVIVVSFLSVCVNNICRNYII